MQYSERTSARRGPLDESGGAMRSERNLPPQVLSTLTNLQRTIQSVRQYADVASDLQREGMLQRNGVAGPRAGSSISTTPANSSTTSLSSQDHPRRVSWDDAKRSESNAFAPTRANDDAALYPSRGRAAAVATAAYHNDPPQFQSTVGRRWGDAMAQLEQELMQPPHQARSSASLLTTPPLHPAEARATVGHSEVMSSSRAGQNQALMSVSAVESDSAAPRAVHSESANTSSQMNPVEPLRDVGMSTSLEFDALRRQSAELAALRMSLKDTTLVHKEELALQRLQHTRELEEAHRTFREAKERLIEESYNRQLITFQSKEELYQEEIKTLQRRMSELERELHSQRLAAQNAQADAEKARTQADVTRQEVESSALEAERLNSELAVARREKLQLHDVVVERDSELRAAKHREQLLTDEGHQLRLKVSNLEEAVRTVDSRAKEQMRKLEHEFAESNMQFELLLTEASEKSLKYERLKSKHRSLKETTSARMKELESALQHAMTAHRELEAETERRDDELRALRADQAQREHDLREERSSHASLIEELRTQIRCTTETHESRLSKKLAEIEGLEKSIGRLQQERADSMRSQKRLEHDVSQLQEQLTIREQELKAVAELHKTELETMRERNEDALAAMRRSLAEKDRRLEHMVSVQSEPLQKLRRQLEDERSKRAALEVQIETLRRAARDAEEESRRELRRDQLRYSPREHSDQKRSSTAMTVSGVESRSVASALESTTWMTSPTETVEVPKEARDLRSGVDEKSLPSSFGAPAARPPLAPNLLPIAESPLPTTTSSHTSNPNPFLESEAQHDTSGAVDPRTSTHEETIRQLKSSSLQVFERIMGSQDAFWRHCQEVVRRTPAARGLRSLRRSSDAIQVDEDPQAELTEVSDQDE